MSVRSAAPEELQDAPLMRRITAFCHPRFPAHADSQGTLEMWLAHLRVSGCSVETTNSPADKPLRQLAIMQDVPVIARDPVGPDAYGYFTEPMNLQQLVLFVPRLYPWAEERDGAGVWDGLGVALQAGVFLRPISVYYPDMPMMSIHGYTPKEGGGIELAIVAPNQADSAIQDFARVLDGAWNALVNARLDQEEDGGEASPQQ